MNLAATAVLLAISVAVVWTVKEMQAYEAQRVCFESGRHNCAVLDVPQRVAIRAPIR